jgi:membrane associated rhomboid family serine protease
MLPQSARDPEGEAIHWSEMIPVSDDVRARSFPFVNIGIIVACTLVFLYELSLSALDLEKFFFDYAVVPAELDAWVHDPEGLRIPSTVITAAFLHAGWLHLAGNMVFLWVFGDNVEDALGHVLYPLFYVVAAAGAVALQVAFDTASTVPMLGASGAIAGVLGGYLVIYPRARVDVLLFPFILPLPAALLILFWFILQLISGLATIGTTSASSGIAFWAHVGGFVTGLALMLAARPSISHRARPSRPARTRRAW